MVTEGIEIGPAVSSDLIRLAVAYSDALDLCTRTQASNIDDVMEFFADEAIRVTVGQEPAVGKAAIRESFLRRSARLQQVVELKGIEPPGGPDRRMKKCNDRYLQLTSSLRAMPNPERQSRAVLY